MISRSFLLTMRNVSDKSCTQNQNTHFMFNNNFPKVVPFMRYVEKYCRSGQATGNMMTAHCMLDTKDYKNALRIRTLLFHGNNGLANAPQGYVYTYTACLVGCQSRCYTQQTVR